jgi:hypothetical protein
MNNIEDAKKYSKTPFSTWGFWVVLVLTIYALFENIMMVRIGYAMGGLSWSNIGGLFANVIPFVIWTVWMYLKAGTPRVFLYGFFIFLTTMSLGFAIEKTFGLI